MSRLIRFTKRGIDIRAAFNWNKQNILDFATSLSEDPKYGMPKERMQHLKRAADLLKAPSTAFTAYEEGKNVIKPKMFPYHNKDIAFTSNHDVLGYLMTNAVGPSLSEDAATEEELQAWLALYCKFMAVLQGGHKAAPYCGHIAYSALPAKEVFFSSGPPRAVAFGASIPTAGLLKPAFKIPTQVIRFRQIEEYFGDLEKQVREHLPPNAIYGSGTGLSLKGEKSQGFGSCAETLAWITMSGLGHGRVMGGVTLKTHQIAMLQDYDELAVRDARLPLCVNCRFWLEHIIKGNLENFPE